ncbi:MAG: hypothetical protein L6R37_003691 [Teloschistes peruensis]|nr:MAG: hypothetical protein L6R37_003691 [Teloschistes peruensis]
MANLKYTLVWILPLISAFTWLGMLLAMFIVWELEGSRAASQSPLYLDGSKPEDSVRDLNSTSIKAIALIPRLKPLFIAGSCVTTIFLDLSFASERWLRHTGRLAKNMGMAEKILSGFSIIFAVAGTFGLILLSIFDTVHHPRLHDGFLLLFMAGYVISAISICAEYQRLGVHFRQYRILRASFWMKLFFILTEFCLAVVFVGTSFTDGHKNIAAVFEWIIALIFTFYVLTFFVDLLPASRNSQARTNMELGHADESTREHGNTNGYAMNGYDGAAEQPKPQVARNY